MWLQLVAAAHAQSAEARVDTYDDGWIHVVAPAASVDVPLKKWDVAGGWDADFVSGATPLVQSDTTSSATFFDEARQGGHVAVTAKPKDTWSVSGTWGGSFESDHVSNSAGVAMTADALGRMATLRAGWSTSLWQAGRSDDPDYAQPGADHALDLGWTQILGRTTTAAVALSGIYSACADELGCQASPYRRVWIDGVVLPERHPDTRARGAASLKVSQAIGQASALHVWYRAYADSWEVTGHTGELSFAQSFAGDRLLLRAGLRGAWQSPASFWRAAYAGEPAFRTADPELSGFSSVVGTLEGTWTLFSVGPAEHVGLSARVQRHHYDYPSFPAYDARDAWVLGGGVDAAF